MTELTYETPILPYPEEIITLESPLPAMILNSLSENAKHSLSAAFNFVEHAFEALNRAISPFASEAALEEIFYLTPQELEDDAPAPVPKKLTKVIDSALFMTTTLTHYTRECVFFRYTNEKLYRLSAPYQHALENILFEIRSVLYYLDHIDNFWAAPHYFSHLTNKEYMARSMAVQLQCASNLRAENHSLTLESVSLILRLAYPGIKPDAHFYRVALTQQAHNTNISLIGVFLISNEAEDSPGNMNPCVLYIPGSEIQQFDSIAQMKLYLATHLINPLVSPNPLPPCVVLSQHSVLWNLTQQGALNERNISLTPLDVTPDFFSNHIQLLIDQQKQNITYLWSQTHFPGAPTELQGRLPRYWIDPGAFDFFGSTVNNHAIPALEAWQKGLVPIVVPENNSPSESPSVPTITTPDNQPRSLQPIKLHVILHHDLALDPWELLSELYFNWSVGTHTFDSIKRDYFSWMISELEQLSGRTVELIEIKKEAAPELHNFSYIGNSLEDVSHRWVSAMTEYLNKISLTTSPLDKFILLTRHDIIPYQVAGFANFLGGDFAIAAITNRKTAAHEVGHMLGAKHDAGEIIYNGWWSQTTMREVDHLSFLRLNAYRFSDRNREHIKTYLNQFD
ncbi:zinc metalloprotease [Pseudomonas sp. S1_E04]